MAAGGLKKLTATAMAMLVVLALLVHTHHEHAAAEPVLVPAGATTTGGEQASAPPVLLIAAGEQLFSLGDFFPELPIEDLGAKAAQCIKRMASKCALKLSIRSCLKAVLVECGIKAA